MSQKYYARSRLEEIREDISIYHKQWRKDRSSRSNEIRYRFSRMMYYKILYEEMGIWFLKRVYKRAERKYDGLFPARDRFNMMHKA